MFHPIPKRNDINITSNRRSFSRNLLDRPIFKHGRRGQYIGKDEVSLYTGEGGIWMCLYKVTKLDGECSIPDQILYWGLGKFACIGYITSGVCKHSKKHYLPKLSRWRHNERDGVSIQRHLGCLLNRLFRRGSKKTSKLRVTDLCEGNSPVTGEFPTQAASNAGNVSIWWRHDIHRYLVTRAITSRSVYLNRFWM